MAGGLKTLGSQFIEPLPAMHPTEVPYNFFLIVLLVKVKVEMSLIGYVK